MKRVIIGNSAAGIAAAEAIRAKDKAGSLSIISAEPYLAYQRFRILGFLEGKVKERELNYRGQDFYKNNAIELMLERKVVEVNLNRKKVIFKDGEFAVFDELIVATGAGVALPSLKGIQKEGVVAVDGLGDVKFISENLPIAHTVILVGSDPVAIVLARILAAKKVETKLLGVLPEPVEGVDVIADQFLTEIIGDSEVKAVRLSNQKVLGASMVLFTGPRKPRVDFLRDTGVRVQSGVLVDGGGRTNVPFVYGVGDASEIEGQQKIYGWENAQGEGRSIGCLT